MNHSYSFQSLKSHFSSSLADIYPPEEVESIFHICLEHKTGMKRISFIDQKNEVIREIDLIPFFEDCIRRLKQNEPIQYILGETEFYDLKLRVNSNVLIPRQETEELVNWVIKDQTGQNIKIIDIGTGSGCIALALKKNLPRSSVFAMDVSEKALLLAKENSKNLQLDISFIHDSILDPNHTELNHFDVIVSNPPYIKKNEQVLMKANVLDHEPHLALFVDNDDPLLFYRKIIEFAVYSLRTGGAIYFEINEAHGADTKELLLEYKFTDVELRQDLNGKDRMIKGIKF